MKYIRTEEGIYEYSSDSKAFDGVYTTTMGVNHLILYKEIVKQADTIEELCDGAIVLSPGHISPFPIYNIYDGRVKRLAKEGFKAFGFILTDKGLIYVAKMNEKGKLELL